MKCEVFSANTTKITTPIFEKYNKDIDNLSGLPIVRNFLHGAGLNSKGEPNSVIQLLNKKNFQPVLEEDVEKFKFIQKFIGRCVENVKDITGTINLSAGMYRKV